MEVYSKSTNMKITFQAHRGDALISRAIRLLSPKYNHISIRIEDTVYEAHIGTGVTETSYKTWKGKKTVVAKKSIEVDLMTGLKVLDFLFNQVGKKYDVLGIFAFIWIFFKPRKDRWYCSELAQVVLYKILGIRSTAENYNQKVSPFTFWDNLKSVEKALALNSKVV